MQQSQNVRNIRHAVGRNIARPPRTTLTKTDCEWKYQFINLQPGQEVVEVVGTFLGTGPGPICTGGSHPASQNTSKYIKILDFYHKMSQTVFEAWAQSHSIWCERVQDEPGGPRWYTSSKKVAQATCALSQFTWHVARTKLHQTLWLSSDNDSTSQWSHASSLIRTCVFDVLFS